MKRTNIELEGKKIEELKKITGLKTSKAIIDYRQDEPIRKSKQHRILELKGKIKLECDLAQMRLSQDLK